MEIIDLKTSLSESAIDKTIATLKTGGLVISPSDTVYGALVDATNPEAVRKLIKFKNRPIGKPISVFVPDFSMLEKQVKVSKDQIQLINELFPGPFTIILPSRHNISVSLESERGTLGVRIPDYNFIIDLLKKYKKPVSATSANLSGRSSHYSVESLLNDLPESKKKLIDLIIDAGKLPRNKPSTILDFTTPKVKILRKGDIVFENKDEFISESAVQTKKIAAFIFNKCFGFASTYDKSTADRQHKPLIFILQGELGTGKTVFVKGIAELLGIQNIVSPTFVIYYEYTSIKRLIEVFVHADLYNIEEANEFKHLGLEKYLRPKNVLCFEWGEKAGEIMDMLKSKGKIVYVNMEYVNEKTRQIKINY